MTTFELMSTIGLFLGPLAAVALTIWSQKRQNHRIRQTALVTTFLDTHHDASSAQYSSVIRLVPIEFAKSKKVVSAWTDYMAHVNYSPTPENADAYERDFQKRKLKLAREMAGAVGLKLSDTDIEGLTYVAKAFVEQTTLTREALVALKRIADALEKPNAQTH